MCRTALWSIHSTQAHKRHKRVSLHIMLLPSLRAFPMWQTSPGTQCFPFGVIGTENRFTHLWCSNVEWSARHTSYHVTLHTIKLYLSFFWRGLLLFACHFCHNRPSILHHAIFKNKTKTCLLSNVFYLQIMPFHCCLFLYLFEFDQAHTL